MSMPSSTLRPQRRFLVLLVVYLLLAAGYSVVMPLGETPDEADHYAYIAYLGQNRSLPVGPAVTQSKHPPLYHSAAALLTTWTGLDFTFLRSNPDALPLGPAKPPNFFIHTTLEDFPWRGGALAMHLARFFSVALGALTLWATYRLGRAVFPDQPAVALCAAALLAGLPGFLFISGAVNNDNAAGASGAVLLWLAAETINRGLSWRRSALMGLALGLGLLSKVGTLALWPAAALAVGGVWWLARTKSTPPQRPTFLTAAAHLLLIYGGGLALAAPWLLRNWRLYGDPFGWALVRATVDQRVGPVNLDVALWLLRGFHWTFWGRFGGAGQVTLPNWLFVVLAALSVVAIGGALHQLRRLWRAAPGDFAPRLALQFLLLTAAPLLMFVSILQYSGIALGTDQVRLMWPALAALAVWAGVAVTGWGDWLRARRTVPVFAGLMAAFGLAVLLGVIRPAFGPPPQVQAAPTAPLARFGALELVSVNLPSQPLAAGEAVPVHLIWRAAAPISTDLRPALRLVHQDGWLAAEWSHAPAGGRFSTDHWRAGDTFTDDYLVLPQPASAGLFKVEVGVRPFGGDWWPAVGSDQPFVRLGEVTMQ